MRHRQTRSAGKLMIPSANNQITFYETKDGKVRIEVRFEHENLWLSQKLMAMLFECSTDNISLHLQNIFKAGELDKNSVTEEYSATAADGKRNRTNFYSLEVIIAVGYRVNSQRGIQFRIWATDKLKKYILKGVSNHIDKYENNFGVICMGNGHVSPQLMDAGENL